jgi:hypothetical protein
MHVEPWVERRMAAWECHRSQHNPKGFSATMPDGVRREMAANEHYLLAAARVPLPDGVTDDLLAGLATAVEAPQVFDGLAESAAALRAELTIHLALAEVCQAYLRNGTEPKQNDAYRRLVDGEQEIIHRLAQFLRIAGEPAGAIEADVKVSSKGKHQESALDRLSFLLSAFERSMARCQSRVKAAATSDQRAVWEELGQAAQAQVTVTRTAMT